MKNYNAINHIIGRMVSLIDRSGSNTKEGLKECLKQLVSHFEYSEQQRKAAIEKKILIKHGDYEDTLIWCSKILNLHGYEINRLSHYFRGDFVEWANNNAMIDPKYKPCMISSAALTALAEGFRRFVICNDREPVNYEELRAYVLSDDDSVVSVKKELERIYGQ